MSEVIAKRLGTEDLEECLRKVGSGTTTEETEVALRGHIAALDADLVRAGNELDAAHLQSKYAWERHAEKDRAYGEALKERDEWKGKALACADERDEAVRLANAEFARLKPSGQVAEDEARVRTAILSDEPPPIVVDEGIAALSRFVAKAQGYEAAVADNAELLDVGDRIHSLASHDEACKMLVGDDYAMCNCAMGDWQQVQRDAASGRHPGAALLEQHRKALVHARNEGLEKARKYVREQLHLVPEAETIDAMKEPEQ